jgi:PKD repeat protein
LSATLTVPSAAAGSVSSFQATTNSGAIGGPFSFAWTFGDGKTDQGAVATIGHTYPGIGNYPASVTVTDGVGRTTTATASALVK